MSKKIRKDVLGKIPQIGDTIVYNPPHYKGLEFFICKGFTKVGLPIEEEGETYSPCRTGFVVIKKELYE